ncbi:helix-turn-helix domain-containing protein [Xylophilus sp. GOD-11R]|uniref:helix-turn-helix domain-containing protein n=1 Tax=Xylophilus sp. GOD-11R TaxID=3089814 RepID=UPI00399BA40D
MTQSELARRLGITQQTLSTLERNAAKVNADRLLQLLNLLGVELVLRRPAPTDLAPAGDEGPAW